MLSQRVNYGFILIAVILTTGAGGCVAGETKSAGCTANEQCGAGMVCFEGVCDTICNTNDQCDTGTFCDAGRCIPASATEAPTIARVEGNGSGADRFVDGLIITGENLDEASASIDGPVSANLTVSNRTAVRAELELPANLAPGDYTLTVANQAGQDQAPMTILKGEDGSPDTPADVLAKLVTVDGPGSGLDADTVDGLAAADLVLASGLLTDIQSVDGAGSGVDADTVDGREAAEFVLASELLTGIQNVDGAGSGVDADTVDGLEASAFVLSSDLLTDIRAVDGPSSGLDADRLDGLDSADFMAADVVRLDRDFAIGGALSAQRLATTLPDVEFVSARVLRIPAGTVIVNGATLTNAGNLLWSFDNGVGLGGIDVGPESTDAWHYLYAVSNPSGGYTSVASVEPPVWAGGMGPAGFSDHVFLASFYHQDTVGIRPFYKRGSVTEFDSRVGIFNQGSRQSWSQNVFVTVDTSLGQPATARRLTFSTVFETNAAYTAVLTRRTGSKGLGHYLTQHTGNATTPAPSSRASEVWSSLAPESGSFEIATTRNISAEFDIFVESYEE